jgi:polygalacturonase
MVVAAAAARTDKPRLMWLPPLVVALLLLSGALLEAAAAAAGTSTTSADDAASSTSSLAAERAATGRRSRLLVASQSTFFSLDSYGARGDGRHDDTQALARAWEAACFSPRPAVLLVPGGKRYLLKLVALSGPCKSSVTVTVEGTLVASRDRSDWIGGGGGTDRRRHWIVFRQVDGLTVGGGGAVDGSGETWWKHSCKINKDLVRACACACIYGCIVILLYLPYVKLRECFCIRVRAAMRGGADGAVVPLLHELEGA